MRYWGQSSSSPARLFAFTLIEVLVVISIVSLLIAVFLPALAQARERAEVITCSSNIRQSAIYVMAYQVENNSLPDTRLNPDFDPITGSSGTSSSNGKIMRGMSSMWAQQVDPDGFQTNKALMDPARGLSVTWETGNWFWRLGSHHTPARDGDSTWDWQVRQQPYYKIFTTGMSLWHHSTYEPWGHSNAWHRGLDELFASGQTTSTAVTNGTLDRIIPAFYDGTYPLLRCPTWQAASTHPDYPTRLTPHGGMQQVDGNFIEGAPLFANFAFSDGHVEYFDKQSAE